MNTNAYAYKEEIKRLFLIAKERYPVSAEKLDSNGAIYYMNGNDGTDFDFSVNNRLCEFFIFYKSGMGYIKICIYDDDTVHIYIFEENAHSPLEHFTENLETVSAKDFAKLMIDIADSKKKYDCDIDLLDWYN